MAAQIHPDPSSAPLRGIADHSVLVVDDETGVRDLMSRWLQAGGYSVASASGADEALGVCQSSAPAVALCDIRMPGRDGLWLAERIRQDFPETAVIVATGIHDVETAVASVPHGVFDYLTKPFGRERLRDAVVRGIEWHRSARDSRCWRERLEEDVQERQTRLGRAIASLKVDSDEMVEAMLSMLTMADPDVLKHAHRVADLSVAIAAALEVSDQEGPVLRRAAMLHDLGKLAMPEAILRKPAALSPDEHSLIRQYPAIGAALVSHLPFLESAARIIAQVQERPDGRGYPEGRSEDISLAARIIAAADAFDTMIHRRIFCAPLSSREAVLELSRCSGTQFDPDVVRALQRLVTTH
jgi:response regulator RpfG family c-di-GMP phosphodiesterase